MSDEFAVGSCDGTGAVINVILGWIPDYVKIWNIEDAAGVHLEVEWIREMVQQSDKDEGISLGNTTDADRTLLTANGIAAYAGGDEIFYDLSQTRWEDAKGGGGNDVTEVYVDGHHRRFEAGSDAFKDFGDVAVGESTAIFDDTPITTSEGFTIGTNSDLNVNGEQLAWIAMKTRE